MTDAAPDPWASTDHDPTGVPPPAAQDIDAIRDGDLEIAYRREQLRAALHNALTTLKPCRGRHRRHEQRPGRMRRRQAFPSLTRSRTWPLIQTATMARY